MKTQAKAKANKKKDALGYLDLMQSTLEQIFPTNRPKVTYNESIYYFKANAKKMNFYVSEEDMEKYVDLFIVAGALSPIRQATERVVRMFSGDSRQEQLTFLKNISPCK